MNNKNFAIIYDFDETLTKKPSFIYTLFPYLGLNHNKFWKMVDIETNKNNSDWVLVFMRFMLEIAREKGLEITEQGLRKMAKKVIFCKGVKGYFKRINSFFEKRFKGKKLRHYIVSGNLREMIEGSKVARYMYNIFASAYYYERGKAVFPCVAVNETSKTQFLFRINKGREKLSEEFNDYMNHDMRPVSFKNMIYIGDGMTDVPSMVIVKANGGNSIAVYNSKKGMETCKKLLKNGRVNYIAKADYSANSSLDKIIKKILQSKA